MYPTLETTVVRSTDKSAISRRVAEAMIDLIGSTLELRPFFSIVLAGGSTPRTLYAMLADEYKSKIPWDRLLIFWGDERYVPMTDEKSNYRMAKEAMLDLVPIPANQIFPIPTQPTNPKEAAAAYAATMKQRLAPCEGRFDLVLLGMGDDGHTASLFPGSPALSEGTLAVVAAQAPVAPRQRITLTFPAINNSRNIFFLVSGIDKAPAMQCVMGHPSTVSVCPAGSVQPSDGNLTWWVDEAAFSLIES